MRKTLKGELLQQAETAFGVKDGKWTRKQEENFAEGFERYLREGTAPTPELKSLFQKFAEFMARLTREFEKLFKINDDIRNVYAQMLGVKTSGIAQAEQAIQAQKGSKQNTKNDGVKAHIINSVAEVKRILESIKNKDITNNETGIVARISSTGINKMTSNKAVEKSIKNGFTRSEHYGATAEIKSLFENGHLVEERADKNNDPNIKSIKRFSSAVDLEDGKQGEALITLKETEENGHRIYSIELDEINPIDMPQSVAKEAQSDSATSSNRWETTDTHARSDNQNIQDTPKSVNSADAPKWSEAGRAFDEAGKQARNEMQKKMFEEDPDALFQTETSTAEHVEIEAVREKYQNTDEWLKAPNGKDTKLSEKQWLQVRTNSFKKWFGDWETDPKNASKVVDENGEPLVVYHGTNADFDTFDKNKIGTSTKNVGIFGKGFYFTENKKLAEGYNRKNGVAAKDGTGGVVTGFVNIKKPFYWNYKNLIKSNIKGFPKNKIKNNTLLPLIEEKQIIKWTEKLEKNGFDGSIYAYDNGTREIVIFNPNQIKSATDNVGAFSSENDNIYFQTETNEGEILGSTVDIINDRLIVDGQDVGLARYEDKGDYIEIDRLYIDKDKQKKGYGKKAIAFLANKYKKEIKLYPLQHAPFLRMGVKRVDGDLFVMDTYKYLNSKNALAVTPEQEAFQKTANNYREGLRRYFAGAMKSHERLTLTQKTPFILRSVGFPNNAITIETKTLAKKIKKHDALSYQILATLPEELTDPIAVSKSQRDDKPNSMIVFTEHLVDDKPIIAVIEMDKIEDGLRINSIRSVYDRDVYAKNGVNVIQENFINKGKYIYIDDKRIENWASQIGVSFPIDLSVSNLNPSNVSIDETSKNVNTGVLKKSDIIGENPHQLYFQAEQDFHEEISAIGDEASIKNELEHMVVGLPTENTAHLFSSTREEQAQHDTLYRKALSDEELERLHKAVSKKQKDTERIQNDTFSKIMKNKEALRLFLKQYSEAEKQHNGLLPLVFKVAKVLYSRKLRC